MMTDKIRARLAPLCGADSRLRLPCGAVLALLLAALLALHNVSSGPLGNLNDIGGWDNRALFIAMTACVHAAVLMAAAVMGRVSLPRMALRQLILTAGLYILLQGINQKTFAYVQQVQPIVRAMDSGGLAAGLAMGGNLSAPAMTLLYLVTRGPVYDMYLLKLLAIACLLGLALLAGRAADNGGLGLRAEVLMALTVILPQGFLNAACTAHIDIAAVLLLAVSLTLAFDRHPRYRAACMVFGASAALSGAVLYALPVFALLAAKKRIDRRWLAAACCLPFAACLPAAFAGMGAEAFSSLLRANFAVQDYAAGTPGLLSMLPRANPAQMPEMFVLSRIPSLDFETNAQQFYQQGHFEIMSMGLTLMGLALYMGACALVLRSNKPALHRTMILALSALMVCPAATTSCWLLLDVLCLYAVLSAPGLRLPACMVLFATAGGSCYPATGETLLPLFAASALCLAALCMLLDVIPMNRTQEAAHE